MKKHIAKFSMLTLCAAAILVVPASSRAQATNNASAAVPAAAPAVAPVAAPAAAVSTPPPAAAQTPPVKKHTASARTTLPFRGKLTAVDTNAMTLIVGKRTFNMTSETVVTKDDKPAVLADGPRVPLSSCSPSGYDPRKPDLLMPIRLGTFTANQTALSGPVTVVAKVMLRVRRVGKPYVDLASLQQWAGASIWTGNLPNGIGKTELMDDATVLAPGYVLQPIAIYK